MRIAPEALAPCAWNTFLARSNPIVLTSVTDASLQVAVNTTTLAPRCRRGGSTPIIGPEAAATLWSEGLFRTFSNRKQVAAYAGLAPTPWQSGSVHRDQGVSKAGNPRLRTTMIQIAWLWLRHQPQSALAVWYRERIKRKGGRLGKTM